MKRKAQQWISGFRKGIPVGLGYLAVSFSFGLIARNQLTPFQAGLMSGTNYTSAGQFAALELIVSGATCLEMILTQGVINMRYSLMSCSLSQRLDDNYPFFHKLIIAAGLTDEVFGVSISQPGKISPFFVYGIMSIAMPCWILGTVFGALLGDVMPPRLMSAMSLALYGMFIAIIIPPAKKNRVIAGLVIISMSLSFLFDRLSFTQSAPAGVKIISLTLIIAIGAALLFPIKEDRVDKNAKSTRIMVREG